jgi:capsular polysaccharide biosynthesis protein
MPDLVSFFIRWWKFILGFSFLAVLIAFIASLLNPKEYLSTATALPANSVVSDKARIFNTNIEALYAEIGSVDELDKIEGTAALDTLFIATAKDLDLVNHYEIKPSVEAVYKAAAKFKKASHISRSAYGELKIKVWDKDRNLAAALANRLLQKIQELHQHLQNENNAATLQKLKDEYALKQQQYKQIADSGVVSSETERELSNTRKTVLLEQLQQYQKTIDQYTLALRTNPQVLLTVESARPSLSPDKPKTLQIVLFTLAAALVCTFLIALSLDTGKNRV